MASVYEIIEYNQNFPVKLFFQRIGHTLRHWHDSIEILFILSGTATVKVENEVSHLSEGDIILINYNQFHETHSEDCTLLSLQLRLSIFHLDWLSPNSTAFSCDSSKDSNKARYTVLKQYLSLLVSNNRSHNWLNSLLDYSNCYRLMNELVKNFSIPADQIQQRSPQKMQKIGEILEYIEGHYAEKITLSSVAQAVFLSPSYLSHFFEDTMGTTIFNYLNNYRLEHSIDNLLHTSQNLIEIAENHGFSSVRAYSTFFKKKYGMLPAQFRKNNRHKSDNSSPDYLSNSYLELKKDFCMETIAAYLPDSSGISDTDTLPVSSEILPPVDTAAKTIRLKHTFRNFCSIGRAYDILYTDNDALLSRVQREIGFKYIKFHGIFDDSLHVYREDAEGNPFYNFYYTDKIIKRLLELGLKPMIELSFMPEALALNKDDTCCTVDFIISEPKDNQKWCDLVKFFTEHCIEVFGKKEVESWIFTFWNEAITNQVFRFSNDSIFLELYRLTYLTVKSVDADICFASTSFACTFFPTKRYERYLQYIERHHLIPDCFLFHFYGTNDEFEHNLEKHGQDFGMSFPLTLSRDPDLMEKYFTAVKSLLRPAFHQPIYLTEWGFSPSHREWLNDTTFSSCYIIRNILQNYDRLDSFCHWNLTDQIDELEEPLQTFHGGTGLFTRNRLPKPSYYAYLFLNRLQDFLLFQQEGCFITVNAEGTKYSIILYHYQHFSDMYANGVLFDVNEQKRDAAFSRHDNKRISFMLTNLANKNYLLKETILNRQSGSVYDKWIEIGGLEPLSEEDVSLLAALSVPVTKKQAGNIQQHLLSYEALLEPLEVRLIEINLRE